MNQLAPIAQSIVTAWLTNAALPSLVPGGLIYGFEKASTTRPFASMVIALEGEPEFDSGLIYSQWYRLTVRVWSNSQLGNAGAIQAALETLLAANSKLATLANNAWTLHISLEPGDVAEMSERIRGQFTFVAGATWLIQLQEQRT